MGWESVAEDHPLLVETVDSEFWRELLERQPEIMHRLLADAHKMAADNPAAIPSLEELGAMFQAPRFTNEPFEAAVRELLGDRSVRWLASKMKVHHSQVQRMISGERSLMSLRSSPSEMMERIEQFARAFSVHPAYFAEWRRLWTLGVLDQVMAMDPRMSIHFWQRFGRREPRRRA